MKISKWTAFLIGLFILVASLLYASIIKDWSVILNFSGRLGLILIGLAALLSGHLRRIAEITFSYMRPRERYDTEINEFRMDLAFILFLIGIPSLIAAVIYLLM